MATYKYSKPNIRLIHATKAGGKHTLTLIGTFNASGEYSTTAAAKMAKLDKAIGISKKGA